MENFYDAIIHGSFMEDDPVKLPLDYNQVLFDYMDLYDPPTVVGVSDAALIRLYGLMIDALSGRRGAVMPHEYLPDIPSDA